SPSSCTGPTSRSRCGRGWRLPDDLAPGRGLARIWIMPWLQIQSVSPPLDRPDVAPRLIGVLRRADAMGLIDATTSTIDRLSLSGVRRLLRPVRDAGIASQPLMELASSDPDDLAGVFDRLAEALAESPSPDREWPRVEETLGAELLGQLLNLSE